MASTQAGSLFRAGLLTWVLTGMAAVSLAGAASRSGPSPNSSDTKKLVRGSSPLETTMVGEIKPLRFSVAGPCEKCVAPFSTSANS
jgi:hypothetical protein